MLIDDFSIVSSVHIWNTFVYHGETRLPYSTACHGVITRCTLASLNKLSFDLMNSFVQTEC